jgi:hypothetical protein
MADIVLRYLIIKKLMRRNKWDRSHTSIENVKKGVPSHLRGAVLDEAERMITDGLLYSKPSTKDLHISLNSAMKPEIERAYEQGKLAKKGRK